MIRTRGRKREGPDSAEDGAPAPVNQAEAEDGEPSGGPHREDPPGGSSKEGQGEEAGQAVLDEMEVLQEEVDRLKDQHLRLAADFENYRKRVKTELAHAWARAQADLVQRLVEALDDLERVSQFTSEDAGPEALMEGVDLVERKLLKALTDAGLEVLDPEGELFDPNTMEAMMIVSVGEDGQDDTVHKVLQKGYLFKDLLVRPARVSVYKGED